MRRALIAVATAATASGAAVATAADPADGTVSASSPKVTWTGSTISSVSQFHAQHTAESDDAPCEAPGCDSFALKVDTAADLTIGVDAGESDAQNVGVRVTLPDGSVVRASGPAAPGKPLKLKIKAAKTGDYVVDYTNYYVDGPVEYNGSAELAVAAPPPAGGAPQPPPSTAPQPGPAPAESFTLTVKAPKRVSARKARKGKTLTVGVAVSREVRNITSILRRGKTEVGRGALGTTSGSAKLKVKLRKGLKKGKYSMYTQATDAQGTKVSRTVAFRVKK